MSPTYPSNGTRPRSDVDPFAAEYLLEPYPYYERLREGGPAVWLDRWDVWAVTRFEQAQAVLKDWKHFTSGAGVGIANLKIEKSWRTPSLLLESDPPDHTRSRAIISRVLSPSAIQSLKVVFTEEADSLLDCLIDAGSFDAVPTMAEAFPLKVFADAVGVPTEGRQNLLVYGDMVFNTMGPRNEHFKRAMANAKPTIAWIAGACQRDALSKNGLGTKIYDAADQGKVSEHDAALIVRSFLSAGIDTTANAIGNALYCLATNPTQWRTFREDPSLARAAFDEVMRFESPFQSFFRTAGEDTQIAGIPIERDQKVMVSLGAANRDPRRWERPDEFDIRRRAGGHVGFGAGIHSCVGQVIARLEIEILLGALARRVSRIELDGTPVRRPHNTLRGFSSLPLRFHS